MRRSLFASLIVFPAIAGAAELAAPAPAQPAPLDSVITGAANTKTKSTPGKRLVSPDTAARLAAATPKFVPPEAVPPPAETVETAPVLRDAAKPRNQIIRLPRFMVGEPRVHVPRAVDVLTPKGRVELGFERRPGLRFGPFSELNHWIAREMLEDDLQAQRRRQEAELWSLYLIRETPSTSIARADTAGQR
jgi:hypothetical protein